MGDGERFVLRSLAASDIHKGVLDRREGLHSFNDDRLKRVCRDHTVRCGGIQLLRLAGF